jgi:hypothetical protein
MDKQLFKVGDRVFDATLWLGSGDFSYVSDF